MSMVQPLFLPPRSQSTEKRLQIRTLIHGSILIRRYFSFFNLLSLRNLWQKYWDSLPRVKSRFLLNKLTAMTPWNVPKISRIHYVSSRMVHYLFLNLPNSLSQSVINSRRLDKLSPMMIKAIGSCVA